MDVAIPDEQWALPVSMTVGDEERLISMRDALEDRAKMLPHGKLSSGQLSELVAARIEQQPRFEIVIGMETISQPRALEEVRARSSIGRTLIDIELRMISKMMKRASNL